jgi:hypothetical protein
MDDSDMTMDDHDLTMEADTAVDMVDDVLQQVLDEYDPPSCFLASEVVDDAIETAMGSLDMKPAPVPGRARDGGEHQSPHKEGYEVTGDNMCFLLCLFLSTSSFLAPTQLRCACGVVC